MAVLIHQNIPPERHLNHHVEDKFSVDVIRSHEIAENGTNSHAVLPTAEHDLVSWAISGTYDENIPVRKRLLDVIEVVIMQVKTTNERQILVDADRSDRFLTKRKAIEIITALAGSFESGSTVCVHSTNDILYPVLVLAIMASNCGWTGTNPAYTSAELQHHFRSSKAKYAIAPVEYLATVTAAASAYEGEIEVIVLSDLVSEVLLEAPTTAPGLTRLRTLRDLLQVPSSPLSSILSKVDINGQAALFSTSGTTGLPKMIQRTHRELILESQAITDANHLKPYEVRRLYCTPMFHAFSFTDMAINTFRLGYPSFYMRKYDDNFAHRMAKYRITEALAVPPILMRLVEQCRTDPSTVQDLQTLQTLICAGAPLSSDLRTTFINYFPPAFRLIQGWGMSEGGWFTTFRFPERDDTGSVGRMVPGFEIRLSDDNGIQYENGIVASELLVRAPQLPRSYFNNAEATAEAFDDEGWLRTGDVGYVRDGKVYLLDRVKDMIKVNGWSIAPAELEAALYKSPRVLDAAVVGSGSALDEHPVIFVVPRSEDTTAVQIVDHLLHSVARYKVAKCEVRFVNSIPRNPSGKILRKLLRQGMQQ